VAGARWSANLNFGERYRVTVIEEVRGLETEGVREDVIDYQKNPDG
jgi:hypothetical protein